MSDSGRLIAVGDIHGCSAALDGLLEAIQPTPDDTLVLLGDYVDRGPDSRGVVERLMRLEKQLKLVPLLGNHELMMLTAFTDHSLAYFWLQSGGQATLDSYGGMPTDVPQEHLDFLRRCVPYYENEQFFCVHANYDPTRPLNQQPPELLFWTHLHQFTPGPHQSGKLAIVGHTPQKSGEVLDVGHLLCLDTYCVGGGWLTAIEMPGRRLWQVDSLGRLRQPAPVLADLPAQGSGAPPLE
jgi:serine/threonine protein phosphatase 1